VRRHETTGGQGRRRQDRTSHLGRRTRRGQHAGNSQALNAWRCCVEGRQRILKRGVRAASASTSPKMRALPRFPEARLRRVIAGISNFADVGDTTTLANPEIVDDIRQHVQSEKVARGQVPRELSPQEMEEIAAFGRAE
jgi:hypothetical protein